MIQNKKKTRRMKNNAKFKEFQYYQKHGGASING